MNMVSDFYHDSSVGNQIDVVLVRMIYLEKEKEEIDLLISPDAENTLESFAKWAEKMNPKDDTHPNHYDIAVLITRYDICSEGTNCDLMGLAHVAAACDSAKAACINEDSGLLLGIVVAHEKVGCDWVIDSGAIEDKCGICKGDGTKCSPVQGEFIETVSQSAYTKIVRVPKGARSVEVSERKPSENILAVKLEKDKTYCINGDNREFKSGDYECAGTMIIYTHPEPDKEVVEMKGPISEDIEIQYAFFKPQDNPGIDYKYYMRSMNVSYTPKYIWDFVGWSECSAKCDGGTMTSEASCIEEQGGRVTPNFCDGIPRPEAKSRVCNQTPCPAK
ncbi:a disintegrin and metalloproteinase with thrombospondin motifs 7 [Lasius niger]|uniref:A disintegrin and metalloproteinase with thrombospondin motifs 7 n=1 Tax=Lasius niger TaxID=67767 RepID=A0A0J7KW01_LASNI|nr:a disintegrin and metalloproteinase with thrombospondin motifs 7 [Lasius niger]